MAIWFGHVQIQLRFNNDPEKVPYGHDTMVEADDEVTARKLMLAEGGKGYEDLDAAVTRIEQVDENATNRAMLGIYKREEGAAEALYQSMGIPWFDE